MRTWHILSALGLLLASGTALACDLDGMGFGRFSPFHGMDARWAGTAPYDEGARRPPAPPDAAADAEPAAAPVPNKVDVAAWSPPAAPRRQAAADPD